MFKTRIRCSRRCGSFGHAWCSLSYFSPLLEYRIWLKLGFIFRHCWSSWSASCFPTAVKFRICLMPAWSTAKTFATNVISQWGNYTFRVGGSQDEHKRLKTALKRHLKSFKTRIKSGFQNLTIFVWFVGPVLGRIWNPKQTHKFTKNN